MPAVVGRVPRMPTPRRKADALSHNLCEVPPRCPAERGTPRRPRFLNRRVNSEGKPIAGGIRGAMSTRKLSPFRLPSSDKS